MSAISDRDAEMMCPLCGALVGDAILHSAWHGAYESKWRELLAGSMRAPDVSGTTPAAPRE